MKDILQHMTIKWEEGKPVVNGLHQGSILVYNFSGIRCSILLVFPITSNEKGREK